MRMSKLLVGLLTALIYIPLTFATTVSPEGRWITIDDRTGAQRAIVNIEFAKDASLKAIIERVIAVAGDTGICANCPGDFKDKKIQGLEFVWGMRKESENVWGGGSILDPKTGKIYRAKMTVMGDKLYVRGYLGYPILGRTQVWIRN